MPSDSWTLEAAEEFLNSFTNYEKMASLKLTRSDLGRVRALLEALGQPQQAVRSVHVTGSKGKGSFCLCLEALLQAAGWQTGAYLSPHLVSVTERIRLNGENLSGQAFADAMLALRDAMERFAQRPTYFEIMTALAWRLFKAADVDLAIVEAGIGGKLDATIVQSPCLTVITAIEKEHTRLLGNTEAEILTQKAGIARPGVPLLAGPLKPELSGLLAACAEKTGAQLIPWEAAVALNHDPAAGRAEVELKPPLKPATFSFKAQDRPFAVNATLAACAAQLLISEKSRIEEHAAVLENVSLPGRKQVFQGRPALVIDVAHTPDSLQALASFLTQQFPDRPIVTIFGVSKDKDIPTLLDRVEKFSRAMVFVCADPLRGQGADALAAQSGHPQKSTAGDMAQAMAKAAALAGPDGVVCACGSFFVAGQAIRDRTKIN